MPKNRFSFTWQRNLGIHNKCCVNIWWNNVQCNTMTAHFLHYYFLVRREVIRCIYSMYCANITMEVMIGMILLDSFRALKSFWSSETLKGSTNDTWKILRNIWWEIILKITRIIFEIWPSNKGWMCFVKSQNPKDDLETAPKTTPCFPNAHYTK